ncbi:probable E3 ubiquitin-protein ligase makorin-1 [Rhineura floridana]|uniref:probable E3 ubiquitin-protein ligase makorin-1 n=1 Tax=Rhineura floridana TaxID=261503 RepID=UPI002AC87FAA|nr:probable E3 ubiquitin-protein ligase makorin-1 [Rhineura floridana]
MEPWLPVGGGGGSGGGGGRRATKASGSSRIPCRNFARGACRWGQNCRFSHDRKSAQICRYFQNGFCDYGDRCSYQHISEAPALSRCGSESAYHGLQGGMLTLNRRGSEPAILPEASVRSWGGGRRGSEPAVSSMAQLQMNFGSMRMTFEEEDEDADKAITPQHPPNWALSKEFVPRQAASGSRSHEQRLDTISLLSEDASTKEAAPPAVSEEPKATDGLGVVAAAAEEVQKSEDVVCGICMDKVSQKTLPQERLFGILPNCTHAYCVGCIRKWRKSRDFHNAVIKGCPECRVTSTYFIPNQYWVFDSEEKEKLIKNFKARTSKIRCKFFVRGNGQCPFKSECIYLHELPGGRLPAAKPQQRPDLRRRRPVVYNPSPSESSDDDDDDMYLIQWALTVALLQRERDIDYSDFLIWNSSDSSD